MNEPQVCHRCGVELKPGEGDWWLVKIEAMADPYPAAINAEDLARDTRAEMAELIGAMSEMSERELHDQVYRRVAITLCHGCYKRWIEDPAGS